MFIQKMTKRTCIYAGALGMLVAIGIQTPFLTFFSTTQSAYTPRTQTKKHIIFDLGGVLIKTSTKRAFLQIGVLDTIRYIITTRTSPRNVSTALRLRLYETLSQVKESDSTHAPIYDEHGTELPELMYLWMVGKEKTADIRMRVSDAIAHHPEWFISSTEQRIIHNMVTMIFTPELFSQTRTLVKNAHKFVLQCKEQGCSVYILSNWDPETFVYMRDNVYPEFFALFDGIIISGNVGCAKPSSEIYQHLLSAYNLDSRECLFIDDQKENIVAARSCGIPSVHATAPLPSDLVACA
jgi:FMN phosphatase YigB (HAD superfamily)